MQDFSIYLKHTLHLDRIVQNMYEFHQEELFQLSGFLQLQYQTIYENSDLKVADLKFPYSKKVDREASPILIVE